MRPKCQYLYYPRTSAGLRARIPHLRLAKGSLTHLDHDIRNVGDPRRRQHLHRPQHARYVEWTRGHAECPRRDEPR